MAACVDFRLGLGGAGLGKEVMLEPCCAPQYSQADTVCFQAEQPSFSTKVIYQHERAWQPALHQVDAPGCHSPLEMFAS